MKRDLLKDITTSAGIQGERVASQPWAEDNAFFHAILRAAPAMREIDKENTTLVLVLQ